MAGETFYVEPATQFNRNDIAVFNYFGNDYSSLPDEYGKFTQHWEKRVQRIVAFSGDTLEIKNGDVFINHSRMITPPSVLLNYELRSTVFIDEFTGKDPHSIRSRQSGDTFIYELPLSIKEAREYELKKPAILSVERKLTNYQVDNSLLAQGSGQGDWTVDNYGPLKIPSPGETIFIDSFNYKVFKNIPGVQLGKYRLQEKLYFMLGDNRYASEDSRYTGLIAHSNMYGVVK